jgi:hypothetical protein
MNHKARQLIFHFGLAKTGTSAIQRALFNHRDELLENNNTLYPGKYENHFYLQALFSKQPESLYHIQVLQLDNSSAIAEFLEEYRQNILKEIDNIKPRRIIISSEYFSGMSVTELKELRSLLESFAEDIILFAYVRDPWSYSVSWKQERIRSGLLKKEAKFGYAMSNVEIFAKFEEAFDKRATVAPYVQRSGGFDVVRDFCQRFGLTLDCDDKFDKMNKSMMFEAACVMLQLNQLYPFFDKNKSFIYDPARDWMAEAIQNSPLSITPIRISKQTTKKIYKKAKKDIEMMEKLYFDGNKIFTEHYKSLKNAHFDDTLSISKFKREQLSNYLLSCMRILSERAITYYINSIFMTGKYYAAIGNLPAARDCFREVLDLFRQHDGAIEELKALDTDVTSGSPPDPEQKPILNQAKEQE